MLIISVSSFIEQKFQVHYTITCFIFIVATVGPYPQSRDPHVTYTTLKGPRIKDPLEVRSPVIVLIGLLNWWNVYMFSVVSL